MREGDVPGPATCEDNNGNRYHNSNGWVSNGAWAIGRCSEDAWLVSWSFTSR